MNLKLRAIGSAFIVLLISNTGSAIDAFRNELEIYKHRKKCNIAVMANYNQFRWIHGHWLARNESRWNIAFNFKKLQHYNSIRYAKIVDLIDASFEAPKDLHALKEFVRRTYGEPTEVSKLIMDIRVLNDKFEFALSEFEDTVGFLQDETEYLRNECEKYRDVLGESLKITNVWIKDTNLYRQFIEKQRVKIENLYLVAMEVARHQAYNSYIEKTNENLDSVKSQLEAALELDRRYGEYQKWWFETSITNQIGMGLHLQQLQYRTPLRIMVSQLQVGIEHERSIAELGDNPTKTRILNEIKFAKSLIEEQIVSLGASGWRGQFEQQKIMISHRRTLVDKNSRQCLMAMKKYDKSTAEIGSEDEFRIAELFYLRVLQACGS